MNVDENGSAEIQARAVARVREAGVKALDSAIIAWIQTVGPETILEATLREIRAVANAF